MEREVAKGGWRDVVLFPQAFETRGVEEADKLVGVMDRPWLNSHNVHEGRQPALLSFCCGRRQ
jgi:hypothetical protein